MGAGLRTLARLVASERAARAEVTDGIHVSVPTPRETPVSEPMAVAPEAIASASTIKPRLAYVVKVIFEYGAYTVKANGRVLRDGLTRARAAIVAATACPDWRHIGYGAWLHNPALRG